jgi:divalent metal cation (Fe/Co/Zn/Cd) transporter
MTAATPTPAVFPARRRLLERRVRLIVSLTISWNVLEAVVGIAAGAAASSTALIGFGLDSVVEVLSALAVAWQFAARDPESRERVALRLIACSFLGLATYVVWESTTALITGRAAERSVIGMALTALSLVVMPLLSWFEHRTGTELQSASVVADSRQTLNCSLLSAAVLIGLAANALLCWAWADPVIGLLIAALAIREGVEAWRGETCADPPLPRQRD